MSGDIAQHDPALYDTLLEEDKDSWAIAPIPGRVPHSIDALAEEEIIPINETLSGISVCSLYAGTSA